MKKFILSSLIVAFLGIGMLLSPAHALAADDTAEDICKFTEDGKHQLDEYDICTICGYKKESVIKGKFGQTYYCNSASKIKFTVTKSGFLHIPHTDYRSNCDVRTSSGAWLETKNYDTDGYYLVTKGTYYIRPEYDHTVCVTFKAYSDKKNTTMKKAITLSASKNSRWDGPFTGAVFCKNAKSSWSRYYKIKITKKKYVAICFDAFYAHVKMYDSRGREVKLKVSYDLGDENIAANYESYKKLSKGTYYIRVECTQNIAKAAKMDKKEDGYIWYGLSYRLNWFLTGNANLVTDDSDD